MPPRLLICLLVVAMSSGAMSAPAGTSAATVNGVVLQRWEVERELAGLITGGTFHRQVSEERRAELERQALDLLVLKEVKLQWVERTGLEVNPARAEEALAQVWARFGNQQAYEAALREKGIEEADFRRAFVRDAAAAAADASVKTAVSAPSVASVDSYFASHRDEYQRPESRRVVHMLFPVSPTAPAEEWEQAEFRAQRLALQVRGGEVALLDAVNDSIESLSPKFRDQVGDLGFVHRGSLQPEIDREVFAADIGAVRGPIRTLFGFHLIQVLEVRAPEQLSLDQVREAVIRHLFDIRKTEALAAFESAESAAAEIEIQGWAGGR